MRLCSIKGCLKKHSGKNLCAMHYMRKYVYKNIPMNLPSLRPNYGIGWHIDKDGYKQILINKKYYREHRVVMSKKLGRQILRSEVVHHINHNKSDNRPENLEIMSFSEHTAHHGKDKVKLEIKNLALKLYRQGIPITKISKKLPIGYSCAYWFIRNSGEPIRGIHNRSLDGKYQKMGKENKKS